MLRGLAVGAQGDAGREIDTSCLAGDVVGGVELADVAHVVGFPADLFQWLAAGLFLRRQAWRQAASGHLVAPVSGGLVYTFNQVTSLPLLASYSKSRAVQRGEHERRLKRHASCRFFGEYAGLARIPD